MSDFIPGYDIVVTIDGVDYSAKASSVALAYGRTTLPKPVFGVVAQAAIAGQATGTFTASGHGDPEVLGFLSAIRTGTSASGPGSVPVTIAYGTINGPAGGTDSFDCVFGEVTTDSTADGQVSWTISGLIDGAVVYTPPAP